MAKQVKKAASAARGKSARPVLDEVDETVVEIPEIEPPTAAKPKKAAKAPKLGPAPGEVIGELNGKSIRRMRVADIDAAHYNPREIRDSALDGLRAVVTEFGLVQPLVWNVRTQRLVGGHQRLKTLDPAGTTELIQVDLDELKEKELNLALNNAHIQGEWTAELGALLDEIETGDPEGAARFGIGDLRVDVPDLQVPEAPDQFPEVGEMDLKHRCPRCSFEF